MRRLVLASASPRRADVLRQLGLDPVVRAEVLDVLRAYDQQTVLGWTLGLLITGGDWEIMIIGKDLFFVGFGDYGYPLYVTYLVWIAVVILLYFPSRAYMRYKLSNKDKAWLTYL